MSNYQLNQFKNMDIHGSKGDLLKYLQNLVEFTKESQLNRSQLNPQIFQDLDQILLLNSDDLNILVESYRFLRNSTAQCPSNQNFIQDSTQLIQNSAKLLKSPSVHDQDQLIIVQRIVLQFIGNACVGNEATCDLLIRENLLDLCSLINSDDSKIAFTSSMILNNALKEKADHFLTKHNFVECILDKIEANEFMILSFELLVKSQHVEEIFTALNPQRKVQFMKILNCLSSKDISQKSLEFFKKEFTNKSDCILKDQLDEDSCSEIVQILELLSSLSAKESYKKILIADKVPLSTAIYLLIYIHQVGLESENLFSPKGKLNQLESLGGEELTHEPFYLFKARLIQLIGNLAHKEKDLGDYVRELKALPIILDCCKLDAKNPYIQEWSILALKNLSEGNPEIQEILRNIELKNNVQM